MKKILLILVLFVVASLLVSCVPTEPQDMLPYCQSNYEGLLATHPDLPPAYVGACVAYMQTGNPSAYASLCGYEPFRNEIEDIYEIPVNTRQQCINFLQNYEEYSQN